MSHPDQSRPTVSARFGISLPTAIGALLFAGAIVFGSSMLGPATEPKTGDAAYSEPTDDFHEAIANQTDGADWTEDTKEPPHHTVDATPKAEPTAESTPKPTPKPKPTEKPAPPSDHLALEVMTFEGKVKLVWSRYNGDGFSYYKVVRSTDATVNWPPDGDDTMVGAVSSPDETWTKEYPPCGAEWHYRVFVVHKTDAGYTILASSAVVAIWVPCFEKPTPPEPVVMAFEVTVVDGHVHLAWEACGSEAFAAYKIVRSQTNPEPKYPLNDGAELIAAIGDQSVTGYTDGAVTAGQTWTYRVMCLGSGADGWYVVGYTAALTVTVPG